MKRVGVRDFRDHATRYLSGDDVLAIERHGQPIGFYVPVGASRQENFVAALERLDQTVKRVLAETGLSEEDLSHLFDLRAPIDDQPVRRDQDVVAEAHAPRC